MNSTHHSDRKPEKRLQDVEFFVSLILQIGVITSACIILLGLVLFFIQYTQKTNPLVTLSYQQFIADTRNFPYTFATIMTALQQDDGVGYIMVGLFLLILTPIVRVATSILLFLHQRDIPMTLVTVLVLLILIGSFFVGIVVK